MKPSMTTLNYMLLFILIIRFQNCKELFRKVNICFTCIYFFVDFLLMVSGIILHLGIMINYFLQL